MQSDIGRRFYVIVVLCDDGKTIVLVIQREKNISSYVYYDIHCVHAVFTVLFFRYIVFAFLMVFAQSSWWFSDYTGIALSPFWARTRKKQQWIKKQTIHFGIKDAPNTLSSIRTLGHTNLLVLTFFRKIHEKSNIFYCSLSVVGRQLYFLHSKYSLLDWQIFVLVAVFYHSFDLVIRIESADANLNFRFLAIKLDFLLERTVTPCPNIFWWRKIVCVGIQCVNAGCVGLQLTI